MDRRRAAGALLALAACIACSTAAPTASNQSAIELFEGPSDGCYYNFQHYGEGDRIMTNEPCLNCTCHNRMLMCYLKVCPFTKPIGQDCTIEKRADQCCPIVTCPDVPVDLLTSTSTSSPAEYGATGLGKVDKYGCSINGKYFPEGSKVPPTPNKPCEHCYCIRNMTTCVMQECTLHVDGCTPIYNKDVCCPVRYSCDHLDDEMLLLDDMSTTVRPTPGFLLTTTTMPSVTQISQNCVHDNQIFADGALIKTEIACEHCYCMKGDIVCVVQECGTPMENEGKNCTSLPPRQGQCCPDTYICEGDELLTEPTTSITFDELSTLSPPRRVEGSGYRNEPDEPYTEIPTFEGSGEEHATTLDSSEMFTPQKQTPLIIDEIYAPSLTTIEPDKEQNTVPDDSKESTSDSKLLQQTTFAQEVSIATQPSIVESITETDTTESKTTSSDYSSPSDSHSYISKDDEFIVTTESELHHTKDESKFTETKSENERTESFDIVEEVTTQRSHPESSSSVTEQGDKTTTYDMSKLDEISLPHVTTSKDDSDDGILTHDKVDNEFLMTTTESRIEPSDTTSVNPVENEIDEDVLPPGRIPGEGDCLLNGITYKNSSSVPNINNCHSSCKCVSSIVKCDPIICSPPPAHMDNMSDCQPIYDTPDACCPTYVCHSRETIPPESHSQMSGTESPKPALESECHGDQCQPHKTKPILPELCSSGSCEPVLEDQEKDCKNGACEYTETITTVALPPLTHPEACIGDACLHSVETCADGKCRPPSTSQTVCDNENGCQPSAACVGSNCVVKPEVTKGDHPICKDSDECKVMNLSSCNGSKCDTSSVDTQVSNENIVPSECTEESCRRKEQSQENIPLPECSGSNCITQEVPHLHIDEPNDLTTEAVIKDQVYTEITTEIIKDSSKLSESEETPSNETQKVTHVEIITENPDTSSKRTTETSEVSLAEDLGQTVTERGESFTDSSDLLATKMEETITDIYDKAQTQDYEKLFPDTYTTKFKEQVTESIEVITKETFADSPSTTQYDKHPTDLHKEDISNIPTKPYEISTDALDIDYEKHEDDVTKTSIIEEFSQTQEFSTKPTKILETTSNLLETYVTDKEFPKKPEIFTETPDKYFTDLEDVLSHVTEKQEETTNKIEEGISTESQSDTSVTLLPEMSTEKHVDVKITEDDVTSPELHHIITEAPGQMTTERSVQESSEPLETKLDETATKKISSEIGIDHISTENPFTEAVPIETTVYELHKIDQKTESPQTIDVETTPANIDTGRKTTESSVEDQENLSKPTDTYDTVTDKQDQLSETQEPSVSFTTQPPTTNKSLAMQTHDISITEEGESNISESSVNEATTSAQEFDLQEITTQPSKIPIVNIQEITTEMIDIYSLEPVTEKLEEPTVTPMKDFDEVSTLLPQETSQDDTNRKEPSITEPRETAFTTSAISMDKIETTLTPIPTAGLGSTISTILSDKDHEIATKTTNTESSMETSEQSTILPEEHSTKSDGHTYPSGVTEKETSTSSEIESGAVTTEFSKQPHEDNTKMPDFLQTNVEMKEPSSTEYTLAPTILFTNSYDDSHATNIPVSIDETKPKEKPLYTTPETMTQFTEKQDTMFTDDNITKVDEYDTKSTDSNKEEHKPTEYTVPNEKEPQNIATNGSETTTQSQESVTKLATELQVDQDISTTVIPMEKQENGQTESPLLLVTDPSESVHSEDGGNTILEKTTKIPQEMILDEEETKIPENYDIKPQIPYTESPQLPVTENKFDSETPSETYSEKESHSESTFISSSPEYTTVKVLDIQDKEEIPMITDNVNLDISTKVSEKLTPTTEYQDTIFTQSPFKTESDLYPTKVLHESTSGALVTVSSEESFTTEAQQISTKYLEMYTKPEKVPVKEHVLETTSEQPQNNVDVTTPDNQRTETLQEDHTDIQQDHNKIDDIRDSEHSISTGLFTTKYPETLDETQNEQTDIPKTSKQEMYTLTPDYYITTEKVIYTEQPVTPDTEIHSSVVHDQEKSTSNEIDVTTPVYKDLTTLKDETLPSEESDRRTLSPGIETVPIEQYTTEKQKITELPQMTINQETGQSETLQEVSSDSPESESATLVPVTEELDHVTSIPQATDGNIVLQTETLPPYPDQKLPVVSDSIDKQTTEVQDITLKPVTEVHVIEDIQTDLPSISVTEKDATADKSTIPILINTIPVETPVEYTEAQESHTETSIPKVTEIFEPTKTEALIPMHTKSEIYVPIATEPSILKETGIIADKVTEPSVPAETEVFVSKVTEASLPKGTGVFVTEVTESSVPKATKVPLSEITEASVPQETEPSLHKVPEDSASETTEASTSDSAKSTSSVATETSVPEETEPSPHKIPEDSVSEIIETSMTASSTPKIPEESEASQPTVTEASVPDVTNVFVTETIGDSISEITEATVADISEPFTAKVTEAIVPVNDSSISQENEIMHKEHESPVYKPKDEVPIESPTSQPPYLLSETTTYLVELQEHTTKVDEAISSVSLIEEDKTKAPETYQTERGDQPLDNLPDKFTKEDSHEEYTTKETYTKKDEQLTTVPPDQASEYTEKILDKTEGVTAEVLLPSESPMPTLSNASFETPFTGEKTMTISPTVSVALEEHEKLTTAGFDVETTTIKKDLPFDTEKTPEHEVVHETTGSEGTFIPVVTKATTIKTLEEITTHLPAVDTKFTTLEDKFSESYSSTSAPEMPQPGITEIQPTEDSPSEFRPSGSSGYGQEPDYVEEDQAFGPGTCRYGGKVYVSAQQIPRDDPCDFCFCFRSDIICLQQSCPPPIQGCHEEPIQGFCCPRYECPVSMATTLNVTTTTTTTTTTLPPHFLSHAYKGAAQRRGCQIKGHSYKVGEVVRASSGPCLHCTCGGDGQMKCDPKACTPEPMLRQMIAAAVSAKRRR